MHDLGERVLVTGGAGFIGSHLVDRLLADSTADVVVFDNFSRGRLSRLVQHRAHPRLQIVEGDIRSAGAVADVIGGTSTVFHLAAQAGLAGAVANVDYTVETNIMGTFNVLRAASQSGVRRLLFTSSAQVYGEPMSLPVAEDAPLLPVNSYGASKLAGEALCRAFRRESGLQSMVLRFASVYGPRDSDRLVALWLDRAEAGKDLVVYGGRQVLDFIGVDQAVEALVRAASSDECLPPINIGSGTGTRITDLARRISRLVGSRSQMRLMPARPVEVTRFVADVGRMRQLLQLEPPLDPLAKLPALLAASIGADAPGGAALTAP